MENENTRPIFPWYKERMQTKYLKTPTSKTSSVGSFVNVRLDDFSDCSSFISRAQGGVTPVIFHGTPNHDSSQKPRKCIFKEHACFSKQMTQKQIRREYVAAMEERLKQHPLAMFPHYKAHMKPELFDKVVSVLDPDMCQNSSSALPTPTGNYAEEVDEKNCTEPSKKEVERAKHKMSANKISNPSPRNPYMLQMNGNGIKKGWKVNQLGTNEDMKVAVKLSQKWFASPNEETNVTESAILGSFDIQDSS